MANYARLESFEIINHLTPYLWVYVHALDPIKSSPIFFSSILYLKMIFFSSPFEVVNSIRHGPN
jgi:hypothetical protein